MEEFRTYIITKLELITPDTISLFLKPENGEIHEYKSGQYTFIRNPKFQNPEVQKPFSLVSIPSNKENIEFGIKIYGEFTQALSKLEVGDKIEVAQPRGNFTFDEDNFPDMVFLIGGIGISPVMSLLRLLVEKHSDSNRTLIYGNRNEELIAFRNELEEMEKDGNLKLVHILSHLDPEDKWEGHRGFISKEIVEKEVDLSKKPVFLMVGPPVFIEIMVKMLTELGVDEEHIKIEELS